MPDITNYSPPPPLPPCPLAKIHNYMAVIIMRVCAKFKQQKTECPPKKKRAERAWEGRDGKQKGMDEEGGARREGCKVERL